VPWWAREFGPRKPSEPLSRFEKVVLAVLGLGVAAPLVVVGVLIFGPSTRSTSGESGS
jgi:hypothetical protein